MHIKRARAAVGASAMRPDPGPSEPPPHVEEAMPGQMERLRAYANERALLKDAAGLARSGWRVADVRYGPSHRGFAGWWRLRRRVIRTATARYVRP